MLLEAAKSSLLLVDIQDRLLPAMEEPERVLTKCSILLKAAAVLGLPITVSEQYPKGLGKTVSSLDISGAAVMEKLAFSCWREATIKKHFISLHEAGRPLVVIAGIEAHVCVLQTCMDLSMAGFGVFVVADAVSSRSPVSVDLALRRMRAAGIEIINTEMAVFELVEKAGTPQFKTLSTFIK
jgi:hypothetical protein